MEWREDIHALVAFEGRVAGSDAERRAARHLEGRLNAIGRDAVTEPISIFPAWHLAHALHAVLAIIASVLAVNLPAAGAALALVVLVSATADVFGVFHLLRRLTGRRASQNVVSAEDGDRPGTLIVSAHYDTARSGYVFGRPLPSALNPLAPFLVSIALVLACAVLRVAGLEGTLLTAVQFVPTVVLIVHLPLFVDVALSDPVPGANDNASGVAAALRLAREHGGRLENLDLWVVLTGAQESGALGMRQFARSRRRELPQSETIFLNLDEIGAGTVRFGGHKELLRLCQEIAEDDPEAHARPLKRRTLSDAAAARLAGYPAVTVFARNARHYVPQHHSSSDTPANLDDEALERSYAFASELVRRVDEELGSSL